MRLSRLFPLFQKRPLCTPISKNLKTNESNTAKHTKDHLGLFYDFELGPLFKNGGLPGEFELQAKTFQEARMMIRGPALDIIQNLSTLNWAEPPVKFLLYGPHGAGKTLSLAHLLNHAHRHDYVIVHVPSVGQWIHSPKEFNQSEKFEGKIDLNLDACDWLNHFKTQNERWLDRLTTGSDHVWNKREVTLNGSKLVELIDHGLNRVKYASETILVLLEEIKRLSQDGSIKTMVAIDGFNGFFEPKTRIYNRGYKPVHPDRFTFFDGFLSLTKPDWKNAVVVVTVDQMVQKDGNGSYLPRYLLGSEGFDHLDPFVPVPVTNFTPKELAAMLGYYVDRRWVTPHPKLEEEVTFLSGSNPLKMMEVCAKM